MLSITRTRLVNCNRILIKSRNFSGNSDNSDNNKNSKLQSPENPFTKTGRILKNDLKSFKNYFIPQKINNNLSDKETTKADSLLHKLIINKESDYDTESNDEYGKFQTHCDILVVGGGGIGSSIAYWLKKRAREGLNVVVLEKDATYKNASTSLSVGGLRQQFSLEENIEMSLYGADFIRDIKENFEDDSVNVNFTPNGYLLLATDESAENLQKNSLLQNSMGAKNELLTAKKLKEKFPWLNTDGITLGCHGLEKEGWFDPWALLSGFKQTALKYGAHYHNAELVGFEYRKQPDILMEGIEPGSFTGLDKAIVKLPNGKLRTIKFAICINAAGAQSGNVARMAKIGDGTGMLQFALPVEPRKRYVYVFDCQDVKEPGINCPLVVDPTHTYFRKDGLGGNYLAGRSPSFEKEPSTDNLDVDHEYFDTDVWPIIAARCPSFEKIKVKAAWAGFYEYNTFDENGIIGQHPYYNNLYIATGFSGHGIQHTPAIGRAISELIIDGDFVTIDLTRLCFDRILIDQPMYELRYGYTLEESNENFDRILTNYK